MIKDDDTQRQRHPATRCLCTRGLRFWVIAITFASVGVLFLGSQIARNFGQSVDWYTGFGQWLGALGSFIAAGAALWISVTDRQRSDAQRERIQVQEDADLNREAGLVRVALEVLGKRQPVGPSIPTASIGVRNRRANRIFDVEVVKFAQRGQDLDVEIDMVNGFAVFPRRPEHEDRFTFKSELEGITLFPDELLVLYQNTVGDYAAVMYTDVKGRRWQIDTAGTVSRR